MENTCDFNCEEHCKQPLHILALLEKERNEEAFEVLRHYPQQSLDARSRIGSVLKP